MLLFETFDRLRINFFGLPISKGSIEFCEIIPKGIDVIHAAGEILWIIIAS
jgi:hypothetical protein